MVESILTFIKQNRLLRVIAIWAGVMLAADVLTGLIGGDILGELNVNSSFATVVGLLLYPVGLAVALGVNAAIAALLGMVLPEKGKQPQRRNALKALLVYSMADAVRGVIIALLLVLTGSSTTEPYGSFSFVGALNFIVSLALVIISTSVLAKLYNITWLKGCLGQILVAIIFGVLMLALAVVGLGGLIGTVGLAGLVG